MVMWQHNKRDPSIYVSSIPWSNIWRDNFDFGQWTIVLFWEHKADSVPEQPNPPDLEDITMPPESPEYGDPDLPMDENHRMIPQDHLQVLLLVSGQDPDRENVEILMVIYG